MSELEVEMTGQTNSESERLCMDPAGQTEMEWCRIARFSGRATEPLGHWATGNGRGGAGHLKLALPEPAESAPPPLCPVSAQCSDSDHSADGVTGCLHSHRAPPRSRRH